MITKRQRAIITLENAADHIYRHVKVDDETGLVTKETRDDAWASAFLRSIIRRELRG
jgi:hypothetical protein